MVKRFEPNVKRITRIVQGIKAEEMFEGRTLVIATKHQKEKVISPLLEKELGVKCLVPENFDTDQLGTFTGEIERELDPLSTIREKCLRAMSMSNTDLGVASEGSFGPHPSIYFINADEELLIFIDKKNKIEILIREISTDTNFNGKMINDKEELFRFAQKAGFPDHGLILRKSKDQIIDIHKGITDAQTLEKVFSELKNKFGDAYVETDMRAMFNPTRMKVIKQATTKLIEKIRAVCPACNMPGFGVSEVKRGLKCSLCGSPTNSILSFIYRCEHCGFTKEEMFPQQKTTEDPGYCDFCNP